MSPVVETRICRVSGKSFDITDDDMKFYEKISPVFDGEKMLIPPPTLCPLERKRRRLSYRGGYRLYRTTCALSAKPIISVYAPNRGYQATDQVIWWSDQVENLDRGMEYDFSQTFTEQFGTLLRETPLPCLSNEYKSNINSDYVQGTNYLKDCYLVFNAQNSQDSAYSEALYDSSDMYDSYFVRECSDSYECIGNLRCQSCISLEESEDCSRVDFSYHCK